MPPRPLQRATSLVAALTVAVLAGSLSACAADPPTVSPGGVDMLQIPTESPDPRDYVDAIDNPWLPLLPGSEWVYQRSGGETVTVTVTEEAREVAGVPVTVVRDVVTNGAGEVLEETLGWFAQDTAGNVWHFGEETPAGSWEAGVDGAQAGIAMLADPRRGDGYQQEYAEDVAEDRATVISLDERLDRGTGSAEDLLLTEETTPLEADLVERQWYAPGTGLVREETVSGGNDEAELVEFTPGAEAR